MCGYILSEGTDWIAVDANEVQNARFFNKLYRPEQKDNSYTCSADIDIFIRHLFEGVGLGSIN